MFSLNLNSSAENTATIFQVNISTPIDTHQESWPLHLPMQEANSSTTLPAQITQGDKLTSNFNIKITIRKTEDHQKVH